MRAEENDRAVQALEVFRIEIPSWGFANMGTRFGKFTRAAAATTIEEKFGDAGYRGSDGLGERRGAEEGKRSLRYKQGGPESSDSGTGGSARTQLRVNGIAPATVVARSMMFPRERVTQALQKYGIVFSEAESTEDLRAKLSRFYAQRTLTKQPILPEDCANAIVWLTSDQSSKTTGHVISVDGGLTEMFLR